MTLKGHEAIIWLSDSDLKAAEPKNQLIRDYLKRDCGTVFNSPSREPM